MSQGGWGEGKQKARKGRWEWKKKTRQRLPPFLSSHFPPLFNSFYFYYFFEHPAGATAKERAFFSVSCIMQICFCRSFYRPQPANHCISLFSCFVCVSVFASVCYEAINFTLNNLEGTWNNVPYFSLQAKSILGEMRVKCNAIKQELESNIQLYKDSVKHSRTVEKQIQVSRYFCLYYWLILIDSIQRNKQYTIERTPHEFFLTYFQMDCTRHRLKRVNHCRVQWKSVLHLAIRASCS